MTDSPDKRQADLDWLYDRQVADPPPSDAVEAAGSRPRIHSEAYDSSDLPAPRPRPVAAPPRAEASRRPAEPRPELRRPADPRPARSARRLPHRRPSRLGRALRLPLFLLVALLVWLLAVPLHAFSQMAVVDESAGGDRPARQPGTAVLLVGNDARPDTGHGEEIGQRADTVMLLYRPPSGRSVLVSLPRDSYVTIPGYGLDKLNAAYAYGAAPLLTQTVEQTTGVRIDGYLEIGFDGFTQLVDAVGGVEVCPEFAIADPMSGLDIQPGCQTLGGEQALAYVRMRYEDPRGDIGRAERQREIIGKVVAKAASPASVLNPVRYWKLSHATAAMLTKGDETGIGDLAGAGLGLMNVSKGEGLSLVVPIADPAGWSETGASVVIWDEAAAAEMFAAIAAGDTSGLDRFAG